MSNVVVVGVQWGDEGKVKFVDLLSQEIDYVVRFQGGNNPGHTARNPRCILFPPGFCMKARFV